MTLLTRTLTFLSSPHVLQDWKSENDISQTPLTAGFQFGFCQSEARAHSLESVGESTEEPPRSSCATVSRQGRESPEKEPGIISWHKRRQFWLTPFCDLDLATMLVPEQVSVVNDFKGSEEVQQKQSRNNSSVVKLALVPPQGKYIAVWSMSLSSAGTKAPLRCRTEGWCWPSWLLSTKAWTLDLCPNSMLNSPLLKLLHKYPCILSLKLPQFCCLRRHCFGKDPWCFHLLQINPFFSWSIDLAVSLGLTPTKRQIQFLVTLSGRWKRETFERALGEFLLISYKGCGFWTCGFIES